MLSSFGGAFVLGLPNKLKARGVAQAIDAALTSGLASSQYPQVIAHSSAFPASPNTNDLFYRTDLATLYSWSGTKWISVTPGAKCSFSVTKGGTNQVMVGAGEAIWWSTVEFDLGSNFTTGTTVAAPGFFTAPFTGVYRFNIRRHITAPVDGGIIETILQKQGPVAIRSIGRASPGSVTQSGSGGMTLLALTAGDVIKTVANDSAALTIAGVT